MTELTPFEQDIREQPEALRRQAEYSLPAEVGALVTRKWDRIILTGMGSSHFVGIPTWRALTRLGLPAWSIDTGRLLDSPGIVTPQTLVIATSQSGQSGEIVEMLNRVESGDLRMGSLIGVTDSTTSTLGLGANVPVLLHSGPEATVSTKSYLNSLAVHARLVTAFAAGDSGSVVDEITATASAISALITEVDFESRARVILAEPTRRLVTIGQADDGATALYTALIAKEASKVAVEGFVGGQFRHGPFELAGAGLTALLFGLRSRGSAPTLHRLAKDLVATGADVLTIGDVHVDGAETIFSPPAAPLTQLAHDAVIAEFFAVALAKANGVTPGAFAFGSKITTAL